MAITSKGQSFTGKTTVRKLAELVHGIRFETLSEACVAESKRRILDALGCGFGGMRSRASLAVCRMAQGLGGRPDATIWGQAEKTSSDRATLANATMLRYLDFMDSHAGQDPCHPCFNIPPVMAVAEQVGASGRDFLAAVVAGYEIQSRLQDACVVGKTGWFSGMFLEFSVPLAVGLLLGLDVDRLTQAAAVSISHGNTLDALSKGVISSSKSIADGMVASIGVISALLAAQGITGPENVVESPHGFEAAIAHSLDYGRQP